MKKILLTIIILFLPTLVYATEYSKFAEKEYAKKINADKVHIVVKKEHVEKYSQEIGCEFVPFIAYGYGDLKVSGQKKQRITYICLLNKNLKPTWSEIYFSK